MELPLGLGYVGINLLKIWCDLVVDLLPSPIPTFYPKYLSFAVGEAGEAEGKEAGEAVEGEAEGKEAGEAVEGEAESKEAEGELEGMEGAWA